MYSWKEGIAAKPRRDRFTGPSPNYRPGSRMNSSKFIIGPASHSPIALDFIYLYNYTLIGPIGLIVCLSLFYLRQDLLEKGKEHV